MPKIDIMIVIHHINLMLKRLLAHPATKNKNLDDPATTECRRRLVLEKAFLRNIYRQWYEAIERRIPEGSGKILELGSGPGFLKQHLPQAVTSDVMRISGIDATCSALDLPFKPGSLRAVVAINVFHHLEDVSRFISEAALCVRPGGKILLIDPWPGKLAKIIYTRWHHEPCDTQAAEWALPPAGPLSGGNDALAWIVFERDKDRFAGRHPQWRVAEVKPMVNLRYFLSGGISLRCLLPARSYALAQAADQMLSLISTDLLATFALIALVRR
jgi:SAM-dependent methyltransferase